MSFLFFLTLNLSLPIYLRLKKPSIPFYARGIGFLEDLFVVLELFLVTGVSIPLAAIMGVFIHLILLLDDKLFQTMHLRLKFSHLRHAGSYYSSAKELGLKKLIGEALALLSLHVVGYLTIYRQFHAKLSLEGGVAILATGIGAFLFSQRIPQTLGFEVGNLFFALQMRWFQRREKKAAAGFLTFPMESFRLLDENYPLLRVTKGFQGEKQFEIKMDRDEKPHVILLFLESFSSHAIGYEKKATPHFDKLSQEGILFSQFYSNGTFTYRALLAGLFGIPGGETMSGLGPYVKIPFVGLPQLMKQAGYTTAFFHNGSLGFDRQRDFLQNHFDLLADRNEMEESPHTSTSWGAHDEWLMRYTVEWLEKQQEPAFTTLFTISNHHPWITPEHHVPPNFESTLNPSHRRFLQTMHYSDHCLGLLMTMLREKNLGQKTVVVVVGDHSQPLGQHQGNFYYSRFLYEENVKVPLLILADGRIALSKVIDEVGSHVDLLPTVMDLLGLQGIQHGCGSSLMRNHSDRVAMLSNPYSESFIGCRKGPWKWMENRLTFEPELYDITQDPLEKNNLAGVYPEIAGDLRIRARNYFEHIYDLHRERKIVPSQDSLLPSSAFHLDFSTTMITDSELEQIITPRIEKLNLRDCLLITDESVAAVLQSCPFLEELNLQGVTDVTDEAFEMPLRERLRNLNISHASISDRGLEKLVSACPNLTFLSLQGKKLTDRGIQALSKCRHLVRLKILQAEQISEEALIGVVNNNRHLGHLVVQGCQNLSDQFLEALQDHPLELLWILDAPLLTDAGVSYLAKLPIRFLTLEGCPLLTDKTVSELSQLNLESAYLNCPGLVHLC